jgi:hypothetical protein
MRSPLPAPAAAGDTAVNGRGAVPSDGPFAPV